MITLRLPRPPSVNSSRKINWRNFKDFQEWTRKADTAVLAYKQLFGVNKIVGPFILKLTIEDSGRGDLDNFAKHAIDYARRLELIVDDSRKYMRMLVIRWGNVQGCRLQIYPLYPDRTITFKRAFKESNQRLS
jgi:Holliday junction resolvase RusA-like endonuclease